MMWDSQRDVLTQTVDRFVTELLTGIGIDAPPVDVVTVADRMGIAVIQDAHQQPRGRQTVVAGRRSIFIRPDERPERTQWAVAHELGETLAHAVFFEAGIDPGEVAPQEREQTANLTASRLLLPALWFPDDAHRLEGNLPDLKPRYATASHELIAMRLLDLSTPTVITIFDQGRQTRRRGNVPARVPPLDRNEQDCWLEVRRFRRACERKHDGHRTQGWPIDEAGWQREILRTTYPDGD
ncbi:MAG: ImmA/IrrE family metallo-endopeptidase [Planctomycetales bacterium]